MMKNDRLINTAKTFCETHGHRLTGPRLHVLEILAQSKMALGAYDILEKLGDYISRPAPPTAYRAIDFWREHGFIHKIESLNAYIACGEEHSDCCDSHVEHLNDIHFLVCDDCSSVTEFHHHAHRDGSLPQGFIAKRTFTETHGTCESCAQQN